MIIRVKLDSETLEKINKLIHRGDYSDEYDFINRAIKNQIQDEFEENVVELRMSQKSGEMLMETKSGAYLHDEEPRLGLDELAKELEVLFSQQNFLSILEDVKGVSLENEEYYGPGTAGLIWIFHNRFFPIKLVLNELANLMAAKKSNWVDLDELKERASDVGYHIAEKLYSHKSKNDIIDLSIGLPASSQKLQLRYRRTRHKDEKVNARIASSKKRFENQFVAKVVESETADGSFSGACYEMGLITIQKGTEGLNVTLTELGKEFVTMKNPILDELLSSKLPLKLTQKVFSDEEVKFIVNKIIPKFKLEKKFVDKILQNKGKELSISQIREIFLEEKKNFFKMYYTTKKLSELKKKFNVSNDSEVVDRVVDNYFDIQSTATMSRLMELGLVNRHLAGNVSSYSII